MIRSEDRSQRGVGLFKRLLATLALTAAVMLSGGCSVNPATGQRQFNVLSTQQEVQIGQEAAPEFIESYGGPVPSAGVRQFVSDLGQRLAAQSERADLPWEFHVVDSAVINAFALPGGKVFISRGLLEAFDNTAQLAGVLGHEIGHVTAQHQGQQISQSLIVQGVAVGLGVAGQANESDILQVLGVGAQVGGSLYLLSYGRNQELEADALGMRYMTRLGYDPAAMLGVMEVLAQASNGAPPEFLSTHPAPATRIRRLEQMVQNYHQRAPQQVQFIDAADVYRQQVLAPLRALPPAEHQQSEQ